MRITLNLSPAASVQDRYALKWAVPATLVGLAALVLLCRASLREYREYRGIQGQLMEVQKRADALRLQEAVLRRRLDDPANRKLLTEAQFVNQLIDQRQLSLAELSARLAGLLPEDARLTSLGVLLPGNRETATCCGWGLPPGTRKPSRLSSMIWKMLPTSKTCPLSARDFRKTFHKASN